MAEEPHRHNMVNIIRTAKSGIDWTINELDAYNIQMFLRTRQHSLVWLNCLFSLTTLILPLLSRPLMKWLTTIHIKSFAVTWI